VDIFYTTRGHPARFNDKSLIRFDKFANKLKNGEVLDDAVFELKHIKAGGDIAKRKFRGAWLLVDNGYLDWSITIPPAKTPTSHSDKGFSDMAESLRKDVECCFGALKGRWRYLKTGIRLFSVKAIDDIWCTCCALHNMLLEIDGQNDDWGSVEMVDINEEFDQDEYNDIPFALRRLRRRRQLMEMEFEEVGESTERVVGGVAVASGDDTEEDVIYRVRDVEFESFRRMLVAHFQICNHENEVHWPIRN
jgi:Plant transposon protein